MNRTVLVLMMAVTVEALVEYAKTFGKAILEKQWKTAAFTVLALYTFGKAVYDIGRNDGSRIVTDHAGQVELSVKPENNHNVIPYLYETDEE